MPTTIDYLRGYAQDGTLVSDPDMLLARSRHSGCLPRGSRDVIGADGVVEILDGPPICKQGPLPAVVAAVQNKIRLDHKHAATVGTAVIVGEVDVNRVDDERQAEHPTDNEESRAEHQPLRVRTEHGRILLPPGVQVFAISPRNNRLDNVSEGVGDTFSKLLRASRLQKPAVWAIQKIWRINDCGCARRQREWNTAYPWPNWWKQSAGTWWKKWI